MANLTLKVRLLLTILVLAMVSTYFISDRALVLTQRQVLSEQSRVLNHAATLMSTTLYTDLATQAQKVEFFANLPLLRSGNMDQTKRQALLLHIKSTSPYYAWVGLTDPAGMIVQDADQLLLGADVSERNWFLEGREKTSFGDAHRATLLENILKREDSNEPLRFVDISSPIRDLDASLQMVLAVHLNLAWAQDLKRKMLADIGDPAIEIILVDHAGNPVLSSYPLLGDPLQTTEFLTNTLTMVEGEQKQVITWPDGEAYLTSVSNTDHPINSPSLGWSIVARKSMNAVYEPVYDFADEVYAFAVGIFLTFMAIVWFAIDRALHPLMNLAQIADRIRQGEEVSLPEIPGKSEVATFSQSLARLINELTRKNRELILADRMFSDNHLAIMITDEKRKIIRINHAFTKFTGYTFDEVLGQTPSILSSGRHDKSFYNNMNTALKEHGSWRGEIWNKDKSGRVFPEFLTIISLANEQDEVTNYIGMFEDITEQKGRERSLDRLKNFDSLTNLPNREAGIRSLNSAIEESQSSGEPFAVIFIDISNFKSINELLGHQSGDQLLRQVSRRLVSLAIEQGFIARWGGDQFMMHAVRADNIIAKRITQQLLEVMSQPFVIGDKEHFLSINCGVSFYPDDATDVATLLRFADIAVLEAKKNRQEPVLFYRPEMNEQVVRHMELEGALRQAIKHDFQGMELFYQPQISSNTGVIKGFEALIRWNSEPFGFVPPDQFIPLAESSGLIEVIGHWVIESACRDLAMINAQRTCALTLSINISGVQLQQTNFVDELIDCVNRHGCERKDLIIEVTETAFMAGDSAANLVLESVREAGFGISIDDFGTGYASLDYIQRFKPTEIKIDRIFIDKMLSDPHCMNIVRFTMNLADSMNLEVVAEGIETQEQLDKLKELGSVIGQGFLLGRPQPLTEVLPQLELNAR